MKKILPWRLVCLLAAAVLFFACNDKDPIPDPEPEELDSAFNGTYSDGADFALNLTFSGYSLPGKSIRFTLTDEDKASLRLTDIFMGDTRTDIAGVGVTALDDGYSFSGTASAGDGTTFAYEGSVRLRSGAEFPTMTFSIKDVLIPTNYLSTVGKFETVNYSNVDVRNGGQIWAPIYDRTNYMSTVFWWTYDIITTDENGELVSSNESMILGSIPILSALADLNIMLHKFLSRFIYLVLGDITFNPDGNMIATYYPIPEELDIANLLTSNPTRTTSSQSSPYNLISYRVSGHSVYIRPDLTLLLDLLGLDLGSLLTRSEDDGNDEDEGGIDLGNIISELLPTILRWTSEGIRFNLVENDPEEVYYSAKESILTGTYNNMYAGNYKLFLDYGELEIIIKNLPLLLNLLGMEDGLSIDIPNLGSLDLNFILERAKTTNTINLGLYLYEPEAPQPEEPEE